MAIAESLLSQKFSEQLLYSYYEAPPGAGVEALFVTQDKGQIETVYGKSDTDSLIGSCVTTRIFGLGRMESNTAEWRRRRWGSAPSSPNRSRRRPGSATPSASPQASSGKG